MSFVEQFEKGGHDTLKLVAVDGLIAVDVEEVKDVLDVVEVGDFSADQVDEGLYHCGKLVFVKSIILVLIKL